MTKHRAPSASLSDALRQGVHKGIIWTLWAAAILMSFHVWGAIEGDRQPDSIVIHTTQQ